MRQYNIKQNGKYIMIIFFSVQKSWKFLDYLATYKVLNYLFC